MSTTTKKHRSSNNICASDRSEIVEFSALDCQPCHSKERLVDGAVHDLRGAAEVVRVDVHNESEAAERFKLRSVPTAIVVEDCKVTSRFSGLIDRDSLASAASSH
ncbi:thioredoxin family protein [Ruegeria profundi]|uniref:thioredoxin family protein n=1 Tax=Ruegeria profundi TaxID=1685378 RepID=UPI0009E77F81